jgi:acyl dehydratase
VLEKRESASRPHAGIVTIHTRTVNQTGLEVLSFKRTFYVYRSDAPQVATPMAAVGRPAPVSQ